MDGCFDDLVRVASDVVIELDESMAEQRRVDSLQLLVARLGDIEQREAALDAWTERMSTTSWRRHGGDDAHVSDPRRLAAPPVVPEPIVIPHLEQLQWRDETKGRRLRHVEVVQKGHEGLAAWRSVNTLRAFLQSILDRVL